MVVRFQHIVRGVGIQPKEIRAQSVFQGFRIACLAHSLLLSLPEL